MGSKNCLNHPNAPAVTMCHGCHKPVCQSCTMITPMGKFCSSECSVRFRETKSMLKEGGGGGGAGKAVIFVVLLLVLGIVAIHFIGGNNETLKKFDLIGKILGK